MGVLDGLYNLLVAIDLVGRIEHWILLYDCCLAAALRALIADGFGGLLSHHKPAILYIQGAVNDT